MRVRLRAMLALAILLAPLLFAPGPAAAEGGWGPILSIRAVEDALFVATAEPGGLFSSADGGRHWRHIGASLPSANLISMRAFPGGNIILCTFDEVLVSRDGGSSWASLKGDGFMKDFLLTRSGTLLRVHWDEGFQSVKAREGEKWARSAGNVDSLVTDVVEAGDGRLWGATFGGGVLFSDDGGLSWRPFDGPENTQALALAWSAATDTLFAGCFEGGVFARRGGEEWRSASEGLPAGSSVQALAVAEDGSVWAGTRRDGCFVSRDGGASWSPLPGGEKASVNAIEPFGDGVVIGTSTGGLSFAGAGLSVWRALLPSDPVTGLVELDGGALAVSRSGRLFHSSDGGREWRGHGEVPTGGAECSALLGTSGGSLLVGCPGGVLLREGGEWSRSSFPSGGAGSLDPVIAMVESGGALYAATWRNGLLRSLDGGRNWERVDTAGAGDDDQEGFAYIHSLASDGARLALATDAGLSASVDGGESWRHSYFNSGLLSVVFDRDGVLWGTSKNGVWRCDLANMEADEGRVDGFRWSPLDYFVDLYRGADGDLIGARRNALHRLVPRGGGYRMEGASLSNVEVLALLPLSDGHLLLGTSGGFFRSEDGGRSWTEVSLP